MYTLLLGLILFINAFGEMKIDFGIGKSGSDWAVVNDVVMGGRSDSGALLTAGTIVFKGVLSLDNNGGFASLRSPLGLYDLSNFSTVEIRYRSSQRKFEMTLSDSRRFYRTNYKYPFADSGGEWQVAVFNLDDFEAYVMGRPKGEKITRDVLKDVVRIGFILSDKMEGAFELEIDYLLFK